MKVKCIDNLDVEQELTEGKVYDVLGEETNGFGEFYSILCDSNREYCYLKERFEPVQEKEEEIPVGNITEIALVCLVCPLFLRNKLYYHIQLMF